MAMALLLPAIAASCIAAAAGATVSAGGSVRSNVVAGPQLSVEVFKPMMRSTDGTVCQCLRLPAVVLDRASGWHLAFANVGTMSATGVYRVGRSLQPAGRTSPCESAARRDAAGDP